jgi:peroxiredoxin
LITDIDPAVRVSRDYIALAERAEILKRVAVGQKAPDFTLNDPEGNPVSLSSLQGKYVMIDFWASWCRPCRQENPNVVRMYNKYRDKGFEILGVSLDEDRNKWVKAIEDDQLTWTHVSDLQRWGSAPGKLYGVNSIPHTVLIDPAGIIIANNLRGAALEQKLQEILVVDQPA